jgi:hypothetical protein
MGGKRWLAADGDCLESAMRDLASRHPALGLHLFNEQGDIRHNIVFLHAGDLVRGRDAGARKLTPGDEVVLTNALAGG